MSDSENIFSGDFDFGSWFTTRVLPWITIVFLGGVGSIVYGYWSLSMQVQRLEKTSCCGQVQGNKESIKELKRAVSILVKIHTSSGDDKDGSLDTLPDWSHSYNGSPAFEAPRSYRYKAVHSDERRGYPVRFIVSKAIKPRDEKRKDRDS